MTDDICVIVIRQRTGEDILAIFTGEDDETIQVRHPYFARYDMSDRHIVMIPYCPLSDESFFNIKRDRIEFVVVARDDVITRYLHNVNRNSPSEQDDRTSQQDESSHSCFIDGNDTKH